CRCETVMRDGTGKYVLNMDAASLPAEAEASGAVVPAVHDPRRRERTRLVAFVRFHAGRVEVREVSCHRHLAREPLAEERGARRLGAAAGGREQGLAPGLVPE